MAKKTHEQFIQEVYKLVGDEYTVKNKYTIGTAKITFLHHKCNREVEITAKDFLAGNRCRYCSKKYKKSHEEFIQEVYDLVGDEYTVLSKYTTTHAHVSMKHNKCGHIYNVKPTNFLVGKRCPKCNGTFKKTTMEFSEQVSQLTDNKYVVQGDYVDSKTKISILHTECETIYSVTPINFLKGHRCPNCATNGFTSEAEKELAEFISTIYNGKIITGEKTLLGGWQELDIYLPELNIAIEYNGLYWHSEEGSCGRYNKDMHLSKTIKCQELGIRLIHIFEDEWEMKKNIVKSKIAHILGCNTNPVIYARKCEIREDISPDERRNFLLKNHIQGNDASILQLGLYYDDKLVSLMTFGEVRSSLGRKTDRSSDNITNFELIRFANDINYRVIGSYSKLFKYFIRNFEYDSIITYADKRWSIGNVYLTNGFIHLHDSRPNYWYYDRCQFHRYHRYSYRKDKLKDKFPDIYTSDKTEKQIMKEAGYYRIWDCGNMVFEYKPK